MKPLSPNTQTLAMLQLLILPCLGCDGYIQHEDKVFVFAAASTTDGVSDLSRQFSENENAIEPTNHFASSASLAKQIENGAPAHIFISADPLWIDQLDGSNLVEESAILFNNKLVLIIPKYSDGRWQPASLQDLTDPRVKSISIGNPASVPVGKYAKATLQAAEIWDSVQSKLIFSSDCRQSLAHTDNALVDAGFVYQTDVIESADVKIATKIDSQLSGEIKYVIALTKFGASSNRAKQYFDFLTSDNAKPKFRQHGFLFSQPDTQ